MESLLINLLIYLLPWHSPWVGAPPRAGTDGVPGSQQYLSSLGHPPGKTAFVTHPGSHEGSDLEKPRPLGLRRLKEPGSRFCVPVQTQCLSHCLYVCTLTDSPFPILPTSPSSGPPWIKPCVLTRPPPIPVFGSCCLLTLMKDSSLGLSQLFLTCEWRSDLPMDVVQVGRVLA